MDLTGQISNEADLIDEAALGSTSAFAQLFNRYYTAIYTFAYRLVLCPAEAADIAQDTFIQAAKSLRAFRREASFKNWLYTIAANKSRDCRRRHLRRTRVSDEWMALHGESAITASETTPQVEAVRAALGLLAPDLREAVTLVYYEGMTHAEAARILDCAETTVSWRLFRAKNKLKKQLRPLAAGRLT